MHQSYVLKALFHYGFTATATSVDNDFENENIVASVLDAHQPNRYLCHFTDRIPQEYFNHLPPAAKELAFDPVHNRMRACVWVVLEHHHSETWDQFLTHIDDAQDMHDLGVCYQNGDGVGKDIHMAVSLFQRAYEVGHSKAMRNPGVCSERGNGVENDVHKEVSLYQRAADAGDAIAMYNLGSHTVSEGC
ncbi:hypothetical protein Pelo_19293 [Pelomyxa schiedti]|nr:hypothetical protein Pelo_19293 [Pelomyxa schiedti]